MSPYLWQPLPYAQKLNISAMQRQLGWVKFLFRKNIWLHGIGTSVVSTPLGPMRCPHFRGSFVSTAAGSILIVGVLSSFQRSLTVLRNNWN